ncbi:MAG: hypothetical protein PHV17_00410 [Candidatus Omnitrophica bacterium]|nr:hypothetical protein [Candidatus Omnitrophota bacterium]
MEKIKINLNPSKEEKLELFFDKAVETNPSLIMVIIVMAAITLVLQMIVFSKGARYRALAREWKQWESKYQAVTELKNEMIKLEQNKKMVEGGLVPVNVSKLLEAVYVSLPSNIWFDILEYRPQKFYIKGKVVKMQEDAMVSLGDKFIKPLKEQKAFTDLFKEINIKNTHKTLYRGVDVLEFEIECLN